MTSNFWLVGLATRVLPIILMPWAIANSVLVNVLTRSQGGAKLPMKVTHFQELEKNRKRNLQGVNPEV